MFESLQEFYDFLEDDKGLIPDYNLSKNILLLRDNIDIQRDKKTCSYELYFSDIRFEKGKISYQITNSNGENYPSLSLFNDNFEYIISRAKSEKFVNPKYKAKYNHLVWESEYKHLSYAKTAIDNYLLFLKDVEFLVDDKMSNRAFFNIYENLFILSQTVNYKRNEVIDFFLSMIDGNKLNGYFAYSIMKLISKEGKKIETKILNKFFYFTENALNQNKYPDFIKEYLELLISLSAKLGKSPKEFQNKLGDYYIQDSEKHKDSFIAHDYYLKALKYYQLAGNKVRIEEVTVLLEKAKQSLNLKLIKVEHTSEALQKWFKTIDDFTTHLVDNYESKDIYDYLMCSDIFPKADVLDKEIRPVTLDLVSVINFDINSNVSGNKKSGINSYHLHIMNFSLRQFGLILSKGIKNGKINFLSLKEFLTKHTWYGSDINHTKPDGEKEIFNWLDLLLPSLFSFFQQAEIDIKTNKKSNIGYILAIDSLVLKFEGILREFSRSIGAQTIEITKNGTKERISFERLLDDKKFNKLVPSDDIAFFKYLFTSNGIDLRNNVAHCFYKPKNYSGAIMWLLISAFLKIGNYTFED